MRLIDTSSWFHALRAKGGAEICQWVANLLKNGQACWCDMVRLELWNGARGAHEHRVISDIEKRLPTLPIDSQTWEQAIKLGRAARSNGITVPNTDLVIAACARYHGVEIEHFDSHFDLIDELWQQS